MILPNQRHAFDLPDGLVYLNCAAQSPSLKESDAAGRRGLKRKLHPWDPERANLEAEITDARRLFGQLIGAEAQNIALMTATSYGAAIAAKNLSIGPGQNIVMLQDQFPSNYYCWQHLAARDGGSIQVVPRPEDGDWTARVIETIDENTGLVALPNCHWMDGGLLDLNQIADRVHDVAAAFFIDATQTIGMMPFDVARLKPDFVACSGYKWLLSPDATGYLYVAPKWLDGQPIEDNHASRIQDTSMEWSAGYGEKYLGDAARFNQGAADSMIHLPMAVAALEQILHWSVPAIEATMRPLTDRIAELAQMRGMRVPPAAHRSAHYIGLYGDNLPENLIDDLKARDVYVSLRGGAIRVSPYLFNDTHDIDRLFAALDELFG